MRDGVGRIDKELDKLENTIDFTIVSATYLINVHGRRCASTAAVAESVV